MHQAIMKLYCGLTTWLLVSQVLATGNNWDTPRQKLLLPRGTQPHSLFRRTSNGRKTRGDSEKPTLRRQRTDPGPQGSPSPRQSLAKSRGMSVGGIKPDRPNERKRARTDQSRLGGSARGGSQHQDSRTPSPRLRSQSPHSGMSDSQAETSSSSESPSLQMLSLSSDHDSGNRRSPDHPSGLARANVRLYGPGVTMVGGSQSYPEYSNIRNDEATSHQIKDSHRAKAAGTTYEHEGGIVASAKGNVVQATVDARKSKQGGKLSSTGHGRDPQEIDVSPGSTASLRHDYLQTGGRIVKIKGELYGKGFVKASSEFVPPPPEPPSQTLQL